MSEYLGEITVSEKIGGPLTKRVALRDSEIVIDSSGYRMANGFAGIALIAGMHPQTFRYCK
jgi:hypothetical protein